MVELTEEVQQPRGFQQVARPFPEAAEPKGLPQLVRGFEQFDEDRKTRGVEIYDVVKVHRQCPAVGKL